MFNFLNQEKEETPANNCLFKGNGIMDVTNFDFPLLVIAAQAAIKG